MNLEKYQKLIPNLELDLEWAEANEWETPICLLDDIREAINLIKNNMDVIYNGNQKKEINEFLKENNLTEDDMQKFWNDCIPINHNVKALNEQGYNWDDMNISVIRGLPTQKERDLKYIEEQKEKERMELENKQKLEMDKKYYNEHFKEIMVNKIDKKEKLTEHELRNIVCEYEYDTEYGDDHRWQREVNTVVKMCNRFFMVLWMEGLTEYQENDYPYQPYEVTKHTYEKTITVTEWKEV